VLDPGALGARLADVRDRISRAAGRVGRDPRSIRLVAISKTFPAVLVRAAAASGQLDFGENKVQEALPKIAATADLPLTWHLVGHLQSNKVRKAVTAFDVVHSVDDGTLLTKLDAAAVHANRRLDVLVQIDLAGEASKHGARPENLEPLIRAALECRAIRLTGLMLLPPALADPESVRPYFVRLRHLRDELVARGIPARHLAELSMGMSQDFEVAVEEGATLVRVGSAIFGRRPVGTGA
jgi:pyridoxal phosphate enzyme (YggS family)